MTLFRQLMLLILSLLLLSFVGTLLVTFHHSKSYYLEQLENNAEDTASTLGLAISSNINDKAIMLSMVDAILDSGYYASISVISLDNRLLIEKTKESVAPKSVPAWFINLVNFPQVKRQALLMNGWNQVGRIEVVSSNALVYLDLWKSTYQVMLWFLLLGLTSLVFAFIATRILFRPLRRMVSQAEAICRKEFDVDSHRPRTVELRLVTDAMNAMVLKLKAIFNQLSKQIEVLKEHAFKDRNTGLSNRRYFEQHFGHMLNFSQAFRSGYLVIIELDGLIEYNQLHGMEAGDKLIKEVANSVKSHSALKCYLQARISGGRFALLVKEEDDAELQILIGQLLTHIRTDVIGNDDRVIVRAVGIYYQYQQTIKQLLLTLEETLVKVKQAGEQSLYLLGRDTQTVMAMPEWRAFLKRALMDKNFTFMSQDVCAGDKSVFHQEVFIQLTGRNQQVLHAGQFIPIAEHLSLTGEIDNLVLEEILPFCARTHTPYAINLSAALIRSSEQSEKFLSTLRLRFAQVQYRLHLEFSEFVVLSQFDLVQRFITELKHIGLTVGVDRVGSSLSPLHYLERLRLDYLKIDGSFVHQVSESDDKLSFIRHLNSIAHTLELQLIASGIESRDEWELLQQYGLHWGQGIYLRKPGKLC